MLAFFLVAPAFAADTSASLESDCLTICATKDYTKAMECFQNFRNKPDAYLATATCAFNNGDDAEAEDYALKSANSKLGWMRFLNMVPGVNVRTGGLGENFVLAYVASGGARHESTAKQYLKTSGQCRNDPDPDACADKYFTSVVSRYQQRSLVAARTSGPAITNPQLTGRITDEFGDPIKRATVNFRCAGRDYFNRTDGNGYYSIDLKNIEPTEACREGRLYVKLEYHDPKDDVIIYQVQFYNQPVFIMKKFNINAVADLRQDLQLTNAMAPPAYYANPGMAMQLANDMAVIYKHMSQAVEFFNDVLKANIRYRLPVEVKTGPAHVWGTHYDPNTGTIVISGVDALIESTDRPKNREWHEFAHHVMFSMYTKWPTESPAVIAAYGTRQNHDGYINPSTADSFMEGFAEFSSLMIADHLAQPRPDVYATWGTMEKDIKAWENKGRDEELAVASALWDLYDSANDDGVDMTLEQVWDLIKVYRRDFKEVYEAAISGKSAAQKSAIDKVFIEHGFFADPTPGNGIYQGYEAFRDANNNGRLDAGENWTDYSQYPNIAVPWMFYKEGMKIGGAANYLRLSRRNTVMTPGHFIKVDSDWPYFRVKVAFLDQPGLNYEVTAENKDGLIFFRIPTDANIEVSPEGTTGNTLSFTSDEFYDGMPESVERGYFMEYDFGIATPAPEVPEELLKETDEGTPYWMAIDLEAKESDYIYNPPKEEPLPLESGAGMAGISLGDGSSFSWIYAVAILLVIVVASVLVIQRRKRRRKN